MALKVGLPHGVGFPPHRNRADSSINPFIGPQQPLYPAYGPLHHHQSGNQGTGLPDCRDEIQNSNPRPINPTTGQAISKRAFKRRQAKARKAAKEAEERQPQQSAQNGTQAPRSQIQYPVLRNERSEPANPERTPQSLSRRGASSSAAQDAISPQSEQAPMAPSAAYGTISSPSHNYEGLSSLNPSAPTEAISRATSFRSPVDNLLDDSDDDVDFEDAVQETLARMGVLLLARQPTSKDTITPKNNIQGSNTLTCPNPKRRQTMTGLAREQYPTQLETTRGRETEAPVGQAYIDRHAKVCPNPSCGRRIEKSKGYDHMACRRPGGCGHEFCWICLADYNPIRLEGNHRHESTCRYYTAIDIRTPMQHPRLPTPAELGWTGQAQRARLARAYAQPPIEDISQSFAALALYPPRTHHYPSGTFPGDVPFVAAHPSTSAPSSALCNGYLYTHPIPATTTHPPIAPPIFPPQGAPRAPSRSWWSWASGRRVVEFGGDVVELQ